MKLLLIFVCLSFSIPEDELVDEKIYAGCHIEFENPAVLNFQKVLNRTPEMEKIDRENIEHGSGRYWILLNKANEKVFNIINDIVEEEEYDLVVEVGYFESLAESIDAPDITDTLVEKSKEPETFLDRIEESVQNVKNIVKEKI